MLSGCSISPSRPPSAETTQQPYTDAPLGYSIAVDPQIFIGDWSSRTTTAGKTAHSLWNGHLDDGQDMFVDIYHSSTPCAPSLTGVSKPETLSTANGTATAGRVDFWDIDNVFYHRGLADLPSISPLCHPPFPPDDTDRLSPSCGGKVPRDEAEEHGMCGQWRRDYELEHGLYSAYALCSEKDGKTVVICVSQVTDDPDLARSIFETFRWTE